MIHQCSIQQPRSEQEPITFLCLEILNINQRSYLRKIINVLTKWDSPIPASPVINIYNGATLFDDWDFIYLNFLLSHSQTGLKFWRCFVFNNCYSKFIFIQLIEAFVRRCSVKKVFFEILQNSQENTCARVFFLIKLQASSLTQVFSCEFFEISKNTFFIEHLWWLLLTWTMYIKTLHVYKNFNIKIYFI